MIRFITIQLRRFIKNMIPNEEPLLGRWGSVKNNSNHNHDYNQGYYYDCADEFKN